MLESINEKQNRKKIKEQKNKSKYSEIRNHQVLNIKGMQDFNFILPYTVQVQAVFSV